MSEYHFSPPCGGVIRAGATRRGARRTARVPGVRSVGLAAVAVAVAVAASGCGAIPRAATGQSSSRALPAATVAMAARTPHVPGTVLRGRHLREYRRMIIGLYRVPGAVALNSRYENPLDQMWNSLRRMYGHVLNPRLHPRARTVSVGERRTAVTRTRQSRGRA